MGVLAELVPRRCTGTNREGVQCGRPAIPGGTVCSNHGGAAPQTREAARRRLLAGADLAIDYMLSMLEPRAPCETCGRSDADRDPVVLRACQLVLDRAGFHPTISVEHSKPMAAAPYARWMPDEQLAQIAVWIADARQRMAAGEAPPKPNQRAYYDAVDAVDAAEDGILLDDIPAAEEPIQSETVLIPVGFPTPEDVNG
jgi:hypothetical protein